MKDVFTRSINELQAMTVRAQLDDCQFLAALAIDILDRNLYERANDCRWWALDPLLRALLADPNAAERAARLAAINELYAVYDSLLLFDANGVVIAVSTSAQDHLVGSTLTAPWSRAALSAPPGAYQTSPFAADPLYGNRPTYIYSAPLRGSADQVIGGIAAVFDSAPQLAAVLSAGLPRSNGAFAMLVDADDMLVASTDARQPGTPAGLPAALRAAALDGGTAQLIALGGQVLALGARGSSGYREYEGSEGRAGQRLMALVCVPLCADDGTHSAQPDRVDAARAVAGPSVPANATTGPIMDIASFYVGRYWLGVPAVGVVEAVRFEGIVRLPNAADSLRGATIYQGETMLLYDLHKALGVAAGSQQDAMVTVVLRGADGRQFGIVVDQLGDIPTVPAPHRASQQHVHGQQLAASVGSNLAWRARWRLIDTDRGGQDSGAAAATKLTGTSPMAAIPDHWSA